MSTASLYARILDRRRRIELDTDRPPRHILDMPELAHLLDALPHVVLIVNRDREIVFANRCLLDMAGLRSIEEVCGLRPGEVLDCQFAWEDGGAGCGLTEGCKACGASAALHSSEAGVADQQECRVLQKTGGRALDLRATATPVVLHGEPFTVLALTDTSHEKRREALERIFFHDLLNLSGSLMGYAELMDRVKPQELPELGRMVSRLVRELADEIAAQRALTMAEADDLPVHWESLSAQRLLNDALEANRNHRAAHDRVLTLAPGSTDMRFVSDRSLLSRILGNMLKNAMEASLPGQTITAGIRADNDMIEFWVHNVTAMPREVQVQVFQRSFSTKGAGRGLGTYSIKLLTERYLGGRASFSSAPDTGTTFRVCFPVAPTATQPLPVLNRQA